MATGNDLVEAAYRKIGRLASGDSATTQEKTDGVSEMNRMVGTWNAEAGPIFFETLSSLTWASGAASKTIGTSGDFNESRPQKVIAAWYRDSGNADHEIDVLTHEEYQRITDKATTGSTPISVAYNPTFASSLGTLFMYPTPSASVTLRLLTLKPLAAFVGADTVTLPPGYEDAVVLNLAVRLADDMGVSLPERTIMQALNSKQAIIDANVTWEVPGINPMTPGQRSGYNPLAYINR